jgi:outer membrane protein assembly factor BamB/tetratricopeptide (TPR) repeat protein
MLQSQRQALMSLTLLVLLLSHPASAQGSWHTSKVSVPDDLVVRQILRRAADAIEQNDLDRALRTWQEALDRMSSKVISKVTGKRLGDETDVVVPGDVFGSIRLEVMDSIRLLKDAGLNRYVQLMEPKAAEQLHAALLQESEALLRDAHLRYFLLPSGRAAALAQIDLMLEQGRFAEAAFHAAAVRRALNRLQIGTELIPLALAREGQALWGQGARDRLQLLIEEAAPLNAETKVAGDVVSLVSFLKGLAESLPEIASGVATVPDPKIFRIRNWSESLKRPRDQGQSMTFDRRARLQMVDYFPIMPAVANGAVYWCDGGSLRAQSLYTGADLWPPINSPVPLGDARLNRNLFFHVTLDRDLVFANLRSKAALEGQRAWQGFQPVETIPSHKLIAVDAASGSVVWNHATPSSFDPDAATFISTLNVNQPPLLVGDTLYVAGTVLKGVFYHWVCAFERATGKLLWKTYVCSGQQELNMFGNPVKECVPGHLTLADGVLYYCTNVGVFASIEAANGTINWISAYEQEPIPSTDNVVTSERHPGWMPSPPAVYEDRVFFAPTDSLGFYAADRKTGALRSVAAAMRTLASRNSYFLGCHDGLLIVAGERITAIKPEDLSLAWTTVNVNSVSNQARLAAIQGRPAILGDMVWYTTPLSNGLSVLRTANLRTGAAKQETITEQPTDQVGNLVVSPEAIVVASQYQISAHFDPKRLMQDLAQAIRERPNDAELYLKLADLEQRQGDLTSAFANFDRAVQLASAMGPLGRDAERRARLALYNGWMRVAKEPARSLRTGPSSVEGRYLKALEYAATPSQRIRTLIDCLDSVAESGDRAAFARIGDRILLEHSSEWVELRGALNGLVPEYPSGMVIPAGLLVRLTLGVQNEQAGNLKAALVQFHQAQITWPDVSLNRDTAWKEMGRRINGLIAKGGRQVYESLEREARARLKEARESADLEGMRSVILRYPQSSVVEEAHMELSKGLVARGDHAAALSELLSSFPRFGTASASALHQCTETLIHLGCLDSAEDFALALKARYSTARLKTDQGDKSAAEWVDALLLTERFQSRVIKDEAQTIEGSLQAAWELKKEQDELMQILKTKGSGGKSKTSVAFVHNGTDLLAIEPKSGKVAWRMRASRTPDVRLHDDRLIAAVDDQILCLKPDTGEELWRAQPVNGYLRDLQCGHGRVYVLQTTLEVGRSLEMISLDIVSGRIIHKTAIPGFMEGTLSLSPLYVAVLSPRESRAIVMDSATAQLLGTPLSFTDRMTPFLNGSNLFVMMTGGTRGNDMVRVTAMDPATNSVAWTQQISVGTPRTLFQDRSRTVIQVRPSPGRNNDDQVLSVIDTTNGRELGRVSLPLNEFGFQAVVQDDLMYVLSMNTTRTNMGLPQRIHAYSVKERRRLWSTVEFAGDQLEMEFVAGKDALWVHKMILGRSPRDTRVGIDELYRIDRASGRVVDLLDLAGANPDRETLPLLAKDGTLLLCTESGITGFRP